jgi:hypothetical protein
MIEIKIKSKDNKVTTVYDDEDITLSDVSLIIYEFERIKKEFLETKFELDFQVKEGGKKDERY